MDIIQAFSPIISVVIAIMGIGWWTYRLNRDLRKELHDGLRDLRQEMQNSLRDLRTDLQGNMESNQGEMRQMLARHVHSTESSEVLIRSLVDG